MSKPPSEPSEAVKRIPVRSEIPEADRWDLTHLYPDDAAWEAAFAELQKHYPGIEQFRGKLAESPASLLAALEFEKSIDQPLERLSTYASLRVSENAADPAFLEREARLQNLQTDIVERCSFMGPELMAVPDREFHALASSPELAGWRTVLERLRRFKPHTLNEREERLLAMSSQPLAGHEETFSQLTNVDLKFGVITDSTGTLTELSPAVSARSRSSPTATCAAVPSINSTQSFPTTNSPSPARWPARCAPMCSKPRRATTPPPSPPPSTGTTSPRRFTPISSAPSARTSPRSTAIMSCGAAPSGSTASIITTPTCRSWRRSPPISHSTRPSTASSPPCIRWAVNTPANSKRGSADAGATVTSPRANEAAPSPADATGRPRIS